MNKYNIEFTVKAGGCYILEAETKEQAELLAKNLIEKYDDPTDAAQEALVTVIGLYYIKDSKTTITNIKCIGEVEKERTIEKVKVISVKKKKTENKLVAGIVIEVKKEEEVIKKKRGRPPKIQER